MFIETVGELHALSVGIANVIFIHNGVRYDIEVPPTVERVAFWQGVFPVRVLVRITNASPPPVVVDIAIDPRLEELDWRLGDPVPDLYQQLPCIENWYPAEETEVQRC